MSAEYHHESINIGKSSKNEQIICFDDLFFSEFFGWKTEKRDKKYYR